MDLFVRVYNADGPLLRIAINDGFTPRGVVVDASIAAGWRNSTSLLREHLADRVKEFWVDPVTFKIQSPFFRGKARTYQRLPYYFHSTYGDAAPSAPQLANLGARGAQESTALQGQFSVSRYLTPYFLLEASDMLLDRTSRFDVWKAWHESHLGAFSTNACLMSLCVSDDLVSNPAAAGKLLRYIGTVRPHSIYFVPVNWELGQNPVLDRAMHAFISGLRAVGVRQIIYSHGPFWTYFLQHWGVSGFITGINYLSTMRSEYITRRGDIDGITHNYYIPFRFAKLAPLAAREALQNGLFKPCHCPACKHGVPNSTNAIRMHYLHARQSEVAAFNAVNDKVALLREWTNDTERFLAKVDSSKIKVSSRPAPTQWLSAMLDSV